ncbi:MAG: hypothetical protein KAS12_04040 [Candidatus Aenigmarchaeota archaeon]|nr:hypothetical protein [Candidatus Aenigmarchaeota archaeon]
MVDNKDIIKDMSSTHTANGVYQPVDTMIYSQLKDSYQQFKKSNLQVSSVNKKEIGTDNDILILKKLSFDGNFVHICVDICTNEKCKEFYYGISVNRIKKIRFQECVDIKIHSHRKCQSMFFDLVEDRIIIFRNIYQIAANGQNIDIAEISQMLIQYINSGIIYTINTLH